MEKTIVDDSQGSEQKNSVKWATFMPDLVLN